MQIATGKSGNELEIGNEHSKLVVGTPKVNGKGLLEQQKLSEDDYFRKWKFFNLK